MQTIVEHPYDLDEPDTEAGYAGDLYADAPGTDDVWYDTQPDEPSTRRWTLTRLLLLLLVLIIAAALLVYIVLPFIEALVTGPPPPLPTPVQT